LPVSSLRSSRALYFARAKQMMKKTRAAMIDDEIAMGRQALPR
jgi:hypothetical protein